MIWTNYDGQESPMLHTKKFVRNLPAVSWEEIFEGLLPYMGVVAILGHVTEMPRSPYPRSLHIEFGFDWQRGFGEDVWHFGQRTYTGPWVYYKLTSEP